jgi:hypothetical protein
MSFLLDSAASARAGPLITCGDYLVGVIGIAPAATGIEPPSNLSRRQRPVFV